MTSHYWLISSSSKGHILKKATKLLLKRNKWSNQSRKPKRFFSQNNQNSWLFNQHSLEYKIMADNWTKWIFMTLWQVCSFSTLIIIFSSWNLEVSSAVCPKSKQLRLSSRLPSLPSGISARCLSHKSFCYNTKHYFLQIWIII